MYKGQAFTIFSKEIIYDNLLVSNILDNLLFQLIKNKLIEVSEKSKISFVGIGFGGLIAQTHCNI